MDDEISIDDYSFFVPPQPGAHNRVFVAKILGSDPKYVFHRKFVNYDSKDKYGGLLCWFELDMYGLYECGINWYKDGAKQGDPPFWRTRKRFVVKDGVVDHYIYDRRNVLRELQELKEYVKSEEAFMDGGDVA